MHRLSLVVLSLWSISVAAAQSEPPVASEAAAVSRSRPALPVAKHSGGIHWGPLLGQWSLNLLLQHAVRVAKEPKTRAALSGPFVHDWFTTVTTFEYNRWDDNDKFVTSNVAHPMQGAVAAAIFWQNNDHVRFSDQDFHSAAYRKALLQAFLFMTFDAVVWKLGPLSESSIGNVGLPAHWWDRDCAQLGIRCEPRTGMNDLVLNEVGGAALTIGFQWLDKHVQKSIEERVQSRVVIDTTRMLTNPAQMVANIMRVRKPWYRDNRR